MVDYQVTYISLCNWIDGYYVVIGAARDPAVLRLEKVTRCYRYWLMYCADIN